MLLSASAVILPSMAMASFNSMCLGSMATLTSMTPYPCGVVVSKFVSSSYHYVHGNVYGGSGRSVRSALKDLLPISWGSSAWVPKISSDGKSPSSLASAASEGLLLGRGDAKTRTGKRFKGSFGNARPTPKNRRREQRPPWQLSPPVPPFSTEEPNAFPWSNR